MPAGTPVVQVRSPRRRKHPTPRGVDCGRTKLQDYDRSDAWLKVRYRGAWYYIPATDLNSRTSFTLLNALFASVVSEVPGAKPVLTLPVN